jgi:hypothetical protein
MSKQRTLKTVNINENIRKMRYVVLIINNLEADKKKISQNVGSFGKSISFSSVFLLLFQVSQTVRIGLNPSPGVLSLYPRRFNVTITEASNSAE